MNRVELAAKGFMGMMIPGALWVSVSMPQYWRLADGRPLTGQPALANHAAYGVDGPTGFDQAQGDNQ